MRTAAALVRTFVLVCAASLLATASTLGQTSEIQSSASAGGGGGGGGGSLVGFSSPGGSGGGGSAGVAGSPPGGIVVNGFEPIGADGHFGSRDMTWLGVEVEESSEALQAQLRLDPGVGLVVIYVATNSPAAKADLEKNDVLVGLEGQPLVHPLQLRKLIQVRKPGDTVKLVFYRGGKKETVTATLAKSVTGSGFQFDNGYGEILRQFGNSADGDAFRNQMKVLRDQLGNIKIDQQKVQEVIRRNIEQAARGYEKAQRQWTNAGRSFDPFLENFARSAAALDDKATITVRNTGRSAKSLVRTDDSGTIVLIKNPKLYLTAHDKGGKLWFDGEIDTPEQRSQVPSDLWTKVEPLLKEMNSGTREKPATGSAPSSETTPDGDDASSQ